MLTSCFCLLLIGSAIKGIWKKDSPALEERRYLIIQKLFGVVSELVRALYIFCTSIPACGLVDDCNVKAYSLVQLYFNLKYYGYCQCVVTRLVTVENFFC